MDRSPGRLALAMALTAAAAGAACERHGTEASALEVEPVAYTEARAACEDFRPTRRALFGDLHVHTSFSFDAAAYDNVLTPADAYRFARGEAVGLPPHDAEGRPLRTVQLDRPLDFAAVTDHVEFLGEIYECTTPGATSYDAPTCQQYRDPETNGAFLFGFLLSLAGPDRVFDVCGPDDAICLASMRTRWQAMQDAAEAAYDRTAACGFTALVGYEYTNTRGVSNLHRNVIFRNATVPERPPSLFEANRPVDLWRQLRDGCKEAGTGCDVLVLPHNSNLSNGQLFAPLYPDATALEEEREIAALRAELEPVVEIFQHKGDSECRNGFAAVQGDPDPACDFEKLRTADAEDCGEEPGSGGMRNTGCVHRLDYVRNVLKEGLAEERRLGLNPYRLGIIGSTDTHNGVPGYVDSLDFQGHVGVVDSTPEERLGPGNVTHDGIINNPGGLAGVWAVENSRDALFEAFRRRETFATSGPRLRIRLFAGWDLPADACARGEEGAARIGYVQGVPMGASLPARPASGGAPRLLAWAGWDPGTMARPGVEIASLQIVKGWLDAEGVAHERVVGVVSAEAGDGDPVDPETCAPRWRGTTEACAVWEDPDFDPAAPAFYYARALEVPTCRWSTRQCLAFAPDARPPLCDDASVPRTVRQRAWSSPVWYGPAP